MSTLQFTILPALAFIAVSHPATYKLVRGVAGGWVASPEGLPKLGGLVLHAILFVLLVSFLMTFFASRKSGFELKPGYKPFSDDFYMKPTFSFGDKPKRDYNPPPTFSFGGGDYAPKPEFSRGRRR